MSGRVSRPIFFHEGFILRHVKTLADGAELLYCDKRQQIKCNASGKRINGEIILHTNHSGHEPNFEVASMKIVKHRIKKIASTSTCSPKQLLEDAQLRYGPLGGCSRLSLSKMIQRARKPPGPKPSTTLTDFIKQDLEAKQELGDEQGIDELEDIKKEVASDYDCFTDRFDAFHESILTNSGQIQFGENINAALDALIADKTVDDQWELPTNESHEEKSPDTVADAPTIFFATLIDTVRNTVRSEMQSVANEIVSSSKESALINQSSFETSTKNFLVSLNNLAAHSQSGALNQRLAALLEKFERNEINFDLDEFLESTISQLEK